MKTITIEQCSEDVKQYFKEYCTGNEKIKTLSQFRLILAKYGLCDNKEMSFRYHNKSNTFSWSAYSMYISCLECGFGWANENCCTFKYKTHTKNVNGYLRNNFFVVADNGNTIVEF